MTGRAAVVVGCVVIAVSAWVEVNGRSTPKPTELRQKTGIRAGNGTRTRDEGLEGPRDTTSPCPQNGPARIRTWNPAVMSRLLCH